jgi:hypothetical protein
VKDRRKRKEEKQTKLIRQSNHHYKYREKEGL